MTHAPSVEAGPVQQQAPLSIALAASQMRLFPGETIQIDMQVVATSDVSGAQLVLNAPANCAISLMPDVPASRAVEIMTLAGGAQVIIWRDVALQAHVPACFSQRIAVQREGWQWRSAEQYRLLHLRCTAGVEGIAKPATDDLTLAVLRQATLMKQLPGIYQDTDIDDSMPRDFMWRLLMIFERLAEPTEERIAHLAAYFDHTVAPAHVLPWLAWCLSFSFDETWDEARQRRALREMARLHRQRGTKSGLKRLLHLYFDEQPRIFEYGASALRLGSEAMLGRNTALGDKRRPHTFRVEFARSLDERETAHARALIAANKPAHTDFELISTPAPTQRQ